MLVSYSQPELNARAFSCPHCGVYAKQDWGLIYRNRLDINNGRLVINQDNKMPGFKATHCENCSGSTIWYNERIVFPFNGASLQPNDDMPAAVKELFLEARNILLLSPASAAALLRLAIRKLCDQLGGKGADTQSDIDFLMQNGLPPKLADALHSLKVYGRDAMQPGQIHEEDNAETAHKLLVFVNMICDNQITQPRLIELYSGPAAD